MEVTNRQKQWHQQKLVECIHDFISRDCQLTRQTLAAVSSLRLSHDLTCQLLSIMIGKYVQRELIKKDMSLTEINENIGRVLDDFRIEHFVQIQDSQFENSEEKKQKIFTIEYSNKNYNALNNIKSFNKHEHLFLLIKTFDSKSVARVKPVVEDIVSSIKSRYQPLLCTISPKIDSSSKENISTSINQLIVSMFPEKSQELQNGHKFIQHKLTSLLNPSLHQLNFSLKQSVEEYITKMVDLLNSNKIPLIFNIKDWIQVDFYYSSQKTIIDAINHLQQECKKKMYEIVNVQGKFATKKESGQSFIDIVIKIADVCCRFNFYFQNNYQQHQLKKYLTKIIRFKFGPSIFGLMETNKKHKKSFSSYLKTIVNGLREQPFDENINLIAVSDFSDEFVKRTEDSISSMSNSMINNVNRLEISPLRLDNRAQTQFERPRLEMKCFSDVFNYASSREEVSTQRSNKKQQTSKNETNNKEQKSSAVTQMEKQQQAKVCQFSEHTDMSNEIAQKDKQLINKSKQIQELRKKVLKMQEDRKRMEDVRLQLTEKVRNQLKQYTLLQRKLQEQERLMSQSNKNIQILKSRNQELEREKPKQIETKSQNSSHVQLADQIQKLESIVSALQEENGSLSATVQTYDSRIATLRKEIEIKTQLQMNSQKLLSRQREAKTLLELEIAQMKKKVEAFQEKDHQEEQSRITHLFEELHQLSNCYKDSAECQKMLKSIQANIINTIKSENIKVCQQLKQHQLKAHQDPPRQTHPQNRTSQSDDSDRQQDKKTNEVKSKTKFIEEPLQRCQNCQAERDATWKAEKKLIYLTIFFLIVLFQAITFSFSIYALN